MVAGGGPARRLLWWGLVGGWSWGGCQVQSGREHRVIPTDAVCLVIAPIGWSVVVAGWVVGGRGWFVVSVCDPLLLVWSGCWCGLVGLVVVGICVLCGWLCGQVVKGARWMPWHQEPMKDVGACDMPRGAGNRAVIRGFPNGGTRRPSWVVTII